MEYLVRIPANSKDIIEVDAPTSTQACQTAAKKVRHLFPTFTLAQIAATGSAWRKTNQNIWTLSRKRLY